MCVIIIIMKKRSEKSILLYEAAKKEFYVNGYNDTIFSNITQRCGAQKSALTYYFGTKAHLAHLIMSEYVNKITDISRKYLIKDKGCDDLLVAIAVEHYIWLTSLAVDEKHKRFMLEAYSAAEHRAYNEVAVEHIRELRDRYNIPLDHASREVEMISITNQGAYKALMVEYFSGSIPVPLETVADFKIRTLLRMLYFDDVKIDETLKKSKELFNEMQIHYDPYFEIYL